MDLGANVVDTFNAALSETSSQEITLGEAEEETANQATQNYTAHPTHGTSNTHTGETNTAIICVRERRVDDDEYNTTLSLVEQTEQRLEASQRENGELLDALGALHQQVARLLESNGRDIANIHGLSFTVPTRDSQSVPSPLSLPLYNDPLVKFRLRIMASTHWMLTGDEFVPGGPLRATRLGTTSQAGGSHGIFPHVKAYNDDNVEYCVIETGKNITIRTKLYKLEGSREVEAKEQEVLDILNTGCTSSEIAHTLPVKLAFLFDAKDEHTGQYKVPVGSGPYKTFERPVCNNETGASQLLSPAESEPYYTKPLQNGQISFTFEVRQGVGTSTSIPKKSNFLFQVKSTHPLLSHLTAYSVPFEVRAKFRRGMQGLQRGEMWGKDTQGNEMRLPLKRKRM